VIHTTQVMDELLNEYIQYEKQHMNPETNESDNREHDNDDREQEEYDDYVERTKEYYYKMSIGDFFRALWFTMSSCYICLSEYVKCKIRWKTRTNAIIDVSKRLAAKNMMYVKIFQAFATNRNIVSPELNQFFSEYTDNVSYTSDEYDINELKEIEARSMECEPRQPLRIVNNYTPIKSGLMSLIFKAYIGPGDDTPVVIKYLRKNISRNFNSSMNNLVMFAKITSYFPYLRTLNIENLVLQNIVCLKDQVCFRKELANITTYYNRWKNYEFVKIPKPYHDYTEKINPDTVVMEYIDGMKITEIDPEDYDPFGRVLAAFNANAAFCSSIYHGDLHPGNILFIKDRHDSTKNGNDAFIYKIGILDFGIIGRLSREDQEILFKALKYIYQRKFNHIIELIISQDLSEIANANNTTTSRVSIPKKNTERYNNLREELKRVLVAYTTPEIKFFGVSEIYEINYILNNYGLMFKRSLYRLFITVAIMDSIGTRLGTKMSYMQYMTDMVVEIFNIKIDDPDEEAEEESDEEEEPEEEEPEEEEPEEEEPEEEEPEEEEPEEDEDCSDNDTAE
jgi:predicted unusual protein kinase regulating ubiquinone biosynthesis (AarF/ABC1/UbiB family)